MNRLRRLISFGAAALGASALAACQPVPPAAATADQNAQDQPTSGQIGPGTDNSGLAAVPACATDMTATLSSGVAITYGGSDARDADLCVLRWAGRSHSLYYGFWSADRPSEMTDEARQAFRTALTSPVGTETSYHARHARLWNQVTIAHLSNGTVTVASTPRPAVELRVVQHDAYGRPRVRAETRYWIDRATGILLRQQTVTPMRDGGQLSNTTWQIGSIRPAT